MDAKELLLENFQAAHDQVAAAFKDLDAVQLAWRPAPQANSIGFLIWHTLRIWDGYQSLLDGTADLYEREGWALRFGFETEGRGSSGAGTGFTSEDVAIVQVQPNLLTEYLEAVLNCTKLYLATATDESLGQDFQVPWWGVLATHALVLSHILSHTLMHVGEAQYARGLLPK